MPNILPPSRSDQLSGRVELELSPAYELVIVFESLSQRASKLNIATKGWIEKTRKRLSADTLSAIDALYFVIPLTLVRKTPAPRTVERFLELLESMPGETFGDELINEHEADPVVLTIWDKIKQGEPIGKELVEPLIEELGDHLDIENFIKCAPQLRNQPLVKQHLVAALREINEVFFRTEIEKILPLLEENLAQARSLFEAKVVPVRQVIEGLTHGITLAEDVAYNQIILAPSYFNSPYVSISKLKDNSIFILYPIQAEENPEVKNKNQQAQLLQRLKALSDKTRLEILQLLAKQPYSTQELVEALKLSQPTISHHMRDLRVAALVRVEQLENTKRYSLRPEFIAQLAEELGEFLGTT